MGLHSQNSVCSMRTIAQRLHRRVLARRQSAAQKEEQITEEVPRSTHSASASAQASASSHNPDPAQISSEDDLETGALGIVSLTGSQRKDLLQKEEFGKDHAQVNEQWNKDQMVSLFRSDNSGKRGETTERRLEGYGTKLLGNI